MEDFGYLSAYSARVRHDTKWPDLLQNGRIQSAAASLIWFRLVLTDIISLKKKKNQRVWGQALNQAVRLCITKGQSGRASNAEGGKVSADLCTAPSSSDAIVSRSNLMRCKGPVHYHRLCQWQTALLSAACPWLNTYRNMAKCHQFV